VLVAERSRGSPLVAEELIAARRELSGASLTGTLEDLVSARISLRSPECRRVLRLVAPAGRPLDHARLAVVAAAFEGLAGGRPPRAHRVAPGRRRCRRRQKREPSTRRRTSCGCSSSRCRCRTSRSTRDRDGALTLRLLRVTAAGPKPCPPRSSRRALAMPRSPR